MTSRRDFLKNSLIVAGAEVDLPLVQPGQGMAASMNYQNMASDVKDAKLKTDRQGVPSPDLLEAVLEAPQLSARSTFRSIKDERPQKTPRRLRFRISAKNLRSHQTRDRGEGSVKL